MSGVKSGITTAGIELSIEWFKKYRDAIKEGAPQVMRAYAQNVYERSQYYCPVRDPSVTPPHDIPGGSLKASGRVQEGELEGEWFVIYGGIGSGDGIHRPPTYAVYVHEMARYEHRSPTQWKFVEQAAKDFIQEAKVSGSTVSGLGLTFFKNVFAGSTPGGGLYTHWFRSDSKVKERSQKE